MSKSAGSIQSLFDVGAVADLTDGELLDRVTDSRDEQAEAVFTVLVERHGPMVFRICRDLVGNAHDAEDACQAVFLLLARQVASVRNRDSVAGWLVAVARRVSVRARREAARRRQIEACKAELTSRPDASLAPVDSWSDLYEAIDRLSPRYREAIVLCHLEGLTHESAAARLHCPVRTLQSRLLRSRSRLKEALIRRGLAPAHGAWALLSPATQPFAPGPLMSRTIARHALMFTHDPAGGGAIPAAVALLAKGALRMSSFHRLKLITASFSTLSLTAGLAWAAVAHHPSAGVPIDRPTPIPSVVPAPPERSVPVEARGIVLDGDGRPAPGVEVVVDAFTSQEVKGRTGEDGRFAISVPENRLDGRALLARSPDDNQYSFFRFDWGLTQVQAAAPIRLTLKPGWNVSVRVTGADRVPVEGAVVEVLGQSQILAQATTGIDGSTWLAIPAETRVDQIVALKAGAGLDYAEFGAIDDSGETQGGLSVANLPPTIELVLELGRPAQIHALNAAGKPAAGVEFAPWLVHKVARKSLLNLGDNPPFAALTGPDGTATFAWMPPIQGETIFFPRDQKIAHRRVRIKADSTVPVITHLGTTEAIRGRVVRPGGVPAAGLLIRASGTGVDGLDQGSGSTRSSVNGFYEMIVPADEGYAVAVDDPDWTASSRLDVRVRPGEPAVGIDFLLTHGTMIRGAVTIGADRRPVPKVGILFEQTGGQGPLTPDDTGRSTSRQIIRQFQAQTDAQGRYAIRVGPGQYSVTGPMRSGTQKVEVAAEPELVRDFHMPRAEKGPLTGQVIAGPTGRPVAAAKVKITAVNFASIPFVVTTDAAGKFQVERLLDPLVVATQNEDGSLAAIVDIGAEDTEAIVALWPSASATGQLLDEQGQPAANQLLDWGRRVYVDSERTTSMTCFGSKVVTDAAGNFTLPALAVGQKYQIGVERNGIYPQAGVVMPEAPGNIDLGTIRVGAYRPPPTAEQLSSFRDDGPKAGDMAPSIEAKTLDGQPLRLSDFRGKFVLLDFWATWCGPCVGEIPTLQAVFDQFGHDGRLVILSLSVDGQVAEPRQFQEQRHLPWLQGFLGAGIHGPTPEAFAVRAIPAFLLVDPDGRVVSRGMRGEIIKTEVGRVLGGTR